jgi:hypothetical protein
MPHEIPNARVFDIDYPGLLPIVAIVDVRLLAQEVERHWDHLPRLGHNLDRLFSGTPNWLSLPIIEMRGTALKFAQGRHRSVAYSMNNHTYFPVLTNSKDVDALLEQFGLDLEGAKAVYDFSELPEMPIRGK